MAELVYAVVAHRVIIDQETNNVSCVDILEEVSTPKLPAVFPEFFLCAAWLRASKEEKKLDLRVRVLDPDGNELLSETAKGLEFTHPRLRVKLRFQALKFEVPGDHRVEVSVKRKKRWVVDMKIPMRINEDPSRLEE